jgi:hypothetical protein
MKNGTIGTHLEGRQTYFVIDLKKYVYYLRYLRNHHFELDFERLLPGIYPVTLYSYPCYYPLNFLPQIVLVLSLPGISGIPGIFYISLLALYLF